MELYACSTCHNSQLLTEFKPSTHDQIRQGKHFQCKTCKRAHRAKNRDRINAKKNADYWANHALRCQQARASHAKNRSRRIADSQRWYKANKERVNAQYAARLRTDPAYREQINARQRTNYAKRMARLIAQGPEALQHYREATNASQRAWTKANPEKSVAKVERRRARKEGVNRISLSAAQWEEIKVAFNHRCAYCNRKMQRLTQDHITPFVENGDHHLHNVVPACKSCNSRKGKGKPLVPVQPLLLTIAPEESKRKTS